MALDSRSLAPLASLCALLVTTGTALAEPPEDDIIGGKKVAVCGWPNVVKVQTGNELCSGTLIHPSVVMTAAHCIIASSSTISFGETGGQLTRTGTCKAGATGEN